ncbi:hypothetical protein [Ornithinimicrobium avium]|nr:hypothetical protein [Ornithinimicrobium avium]
MEKKEPGNVGDSLLRKLEEFGGTLGEEERAAFVQLLGGQGAPTVEKGRVSKEDFRKALDFLAASRAGSFEVSRMRDDDGFWAQWAQRQY